jgi:hypothetical protein
MLLRKLAAMEWRFLGAVFWIPALVGLLVAGRRGMPLAAAGISMMIVAAAITTFYASHYVAPMAGLVVLYIVVGVRCLRAWPGAGRSVRRRLVVPGTILLGALAAVPHARRQLEVTGNDRAWTAVRRDIERSLAARGGRHVVLVRYAPGAPLMAEWVYNGAEIDEQCVVWAHDMGAAANEALLGYFAERQPWSLRVEATSARLLPAVIGRQSTTDRAMPPAPPKPADVTALPRRW